MTATLILANYRTRFAADVADIDAQIAVKEDEARRVNGELHALVNAREILETRHNAELYLALHVKVDPLTGEPMARPGRKPGRGEAQEPLPVSDPPPPTTTPETPTTGTDQGSGSAGEDAPPADDASGLAAAFEPANEWASCAIGKAHGHAIAVLGYTANELTGLGEVQIRAICKHRVAPAEFGGVVVGGVLVDGVAWLLEASARAIP